MRKEFTHMRRDPRTLMAVFFMPILQLLLLGYATNTDVKNVPTAVFDQDNSAGSRALLEAYRQTGYFSMDFTVYSDNDINNLISAGRARVGIIIPPGYGTDVASGKKVEVAVLIDGSDPTIAGTALSTATLVGHIFAVAAACSQRRGGRGWGGIASGCAHPCALQPRSSLDLQHDSGSHRHDFDADHHHAHQRGHCEGARARHN
jgi:ABC-2 type transport system permease protein